MRRISFVVAIVLCASLVCAESSVLKISPLKTDMNFSIGEDPKCINVTIYPDDRQMTIASLWTKNSPGTYENYTLKSKSVGVDVVSKRIEPGKYAVCFEPHHSGELHGIVLFQQKESLIRVGIWIDINVTQLNPMEAISVVTGNVVGANGTNIGLALVFILLVIILFLVISKAKLGFRTTKNKYP